MKLRRTPETDVTFGYKSCRNQQTLGLLPLPEFSGVLKETSGGKSPEFSKAPSVCRRTEKSDETLGLRSSPEFSGGNSGVALRDLPGAAIDSGGLSPLSRRDPRVSDGDPSSKTRKLRPRSSSQAKAAADLREQRSSLEKEIEAAEGEFSAANEAQQPFKAAFLCAHAELVRLHGVRQVERIGKDVMLAAYDRRMFAGHDGHPYRTEADDLARWLKRLRDELKAVNAEIGT